MRGTSQSKYTTKPMFMYVFSTDMFSKSIVLLDLNQRHPFRDNKAFTNSYCHIVINPLLFVIS